MLVEADLDHAAGVSLATDGACGSLADVLAARRTVLEVLRTGPLGHSSSRRACASTAAIDWTATAQQRLIAELEQLSPHAEIVVVDAGSSRGPLARRFWQAASATLLVATPDETAVAQGYAAIKLLAADTPAAAVYSLLNQISDPLEARGVHDRLGRDLPALSGFEN